MPVLDWELCIEEILGRGRKLIEIRAVRSRFAGCEKQVGEVSEMAQGRKDGVNPAHGAISRLPGEHAFLQCPDFPSRYGRDES